jgi:flagellin-like hook-associated protein FlgL
MVDSVNASGFAGLQQLNLVSGLVPPQTLGSVDFRRPADSATVDLVKRDLGNVSGIRSVKDALGAAEAQASAAVGAAGAIRDVLLDLRSLAARARDETLTDRERATLTADFATGLSRIDEIATGATVAGVNLATSPASERRIPRSGGGETIAVAGQDLTAGGLGLDRSRFNARQNVDGDDVAVDRAAGLNALRPGIPDIARSSANTFVDPLAELDPTRAEEAVAEIDNALVALDTRETALVATADSLTPEIENANTALTALTDKSFRELIDPDLSEEDAALKALVIRDELGSFRPPIANVDGQSIIGLFGERQQVKPAVPAEGSRSRGNSFRVGNAEGPPF